MMQVELGIVLLNGLMILPAGFPGYEIGIDMPGKPSNSIGHCLLLTVPELDLQLRLHDLYMGTLLWISCLYQELTIFQK